MRARSVHLQNPKHDARNPKQTPKSEYQRLETNATIPAVRRVFFSVVWDIGLPVRVRTQTGILGFEFVSDFGFEISDLVAAAGRVRGTKTQKLLWPRSQRRGRDTIMNHEHGMNRWTKAALATIPLVFLLLTSGCALVGKPTAAADRFAGSPYDFGCALVGKPTVAGASTLSYVPYRAATKPSVPTPYQAEGCFFGYHDTCWRSWPECWSGCSTFKSNGEGADGLPAPALEPIPAPIPVPIDTEQPPAGSGQ
jgi:hypothetical protein